MGPQSLDFLHCGWGRRDMEQGLWQVNAAIGKDCTDNLDEQDHDAGDEDFVQSARGVVREWLKNIKRYAELRAGWGRRLLKWVLDRFILRLKVSQRRVI